MTDVLPSYSDILGQLDSEIFSAKPLSDEKIKKSLGRINDALNSNEANQQLIDEINALSEHALSIDTSFRSVSNLLNNIQAKDASRPLQSAVRNLAEGWEDHHNTYIALLWKSREVAGKAQGAADDFAVDFVAYLLNTNSSSQEKQMEIDSYMRKLEAHQADAQGLSQGFSELQRNIGIFTNEWKAAIEKYKPQKINQRIEKLETDIQELNDVVDKLQEKIKKLAVSLGIISTTTGISGALSRICPAFWVVTVAGAIGTTFSQGRYNKAIRAREQAQEDINNKKSQLSVAQADLTVVAELQVALTAGESDLRNISERLVAFSSVWAVIRADLQQIKEKIEYVQITTAKTLLELRLETTANLYIALGKALRQYQIAVKADNSIFEVLKAGHSAKKDGEDSDDEEKEISDDDGYY